MIEISKLHIYKNFKPLEIVNVLDKGKPGNQYRVISESKETIGSFVFSDGFIENLSIESKFRRTKTSANALISIYEFVKKMAIKNGICNLFFRGYNNNPNNVVQMYSKVAIPLPAGDVTFFTLPVETDQKKLNEIMKNIIDNLTQNMQNIISPK